MQVKAPRCDGIVQSELLLFYFVPSAPQMNVPVTGKLAMIKLTKNADIFPAIPNTASVRILWFIRSNLSARFVSGNLTWI